MKNIIVNVSTETTVTINGHDVATVIKEAAFVAHSVLEELSVYRQKNELDDLTFKCEGDCCKFLDMIGD